MATAIYGSTHTLTSIGLSEPSVTSAETTHSLDFSELSQSGEDRQHEEVPQDTESSQWKVCHLHPGSYCMCIYSPLQKEGKDGKWGKWNPKPSKGIVSRTGIGWQWVIESFFKNPEKFIQMMDVSAGLCKEKREQFILSRILPSLEESWGKCSESNKEVYKILAKLSHSVNSGKVVRHSLQLLLHLISKDNFESGHNGLLVLEATMRSSIFTSEWLFRKVEVAERTLKLFVYSRVWALLLKSEILRGELLVSDLDHNDLKMVVEELQRHLRQLKNKKKDVFRYSAEFTLSAHSKLLKPNESSTTAARMKNFMEECQEFCANPEKESKDLKILRTLRAKKKDVEWAELHCILFYLNEKVYSERPTPQMETERRAMQLMRLIVEAYLGGGRADWRFCLASSLLLAEIAKNNVTKEIRIEAGGCLANLLKDAKVQRRPECRAIVEKRASELLLGPDSYIRMLMVHFLSKNQLGEESLPRKRHTDHLSSVYGTHTLDIESAIINQSTSCFISQGVFQEQKVAVKVLYVKKNHLLKDNPEFEDRKRLIDEAENLRRLSSSRHPNFPLLLGYDTKSLPYHIITAFERWGNLRQFLRRRRDTEPHVRPVDLLKMLTGISRALSHLQELNLVHRCVKAENVLVGDNYVCKLSGLHSLRPLTLEPVDQDFWYEGYCSLEVPQYTCTSTDEDLPLRWQAPECLASHRFSTASDVWAFGVLTYEVLTHGCTPYRHLVKDKEVSYHITQHREIVPKENCFEDSEYELIKQCCEYQEDHRPRVFDVTEQLEEIIRQLDEDKPRPDPPPLYIDKKDCGSSIAQEANDVLYSTISEICEDPQSESTEEEGSIQSDPIYDDVLEDFVRTENQGCTVIRERLSQQDVQHVRELRCLNHPNIVTIWKDDEEHSIISIISRPDCTYGNLKDYVLQRQCRREDIVMFLSQVASAFHYFHSKHIVQGDLRAEYLNVVSPNKVQVSRLGRSKTLSMSAYEITSTSCVVEAAMPPDATRWSAPEVIMDGHYTHASDIWAFGILAWELYTSYHKGQEGEQFCIPYHGLYNDEILPYQRDKGPLEQPEGCPDWVYIIMHQCWAFDPTQRPPFLAIFDCLTSREPMKSWIMKNWLEKHNENEWPDLSVSQGNDATHVLDEQSHPQEKNIKQMCSEDFFAKHRYRYVSNRGDDCEPYASCPLEAGEVTIINPSISSQYQVPNSSQDDEATIGDSSGYSSPVTTSETGNQKDNPCHVNVAAGGPSKDHMNAIYAEISLKNPPHPPLPTPVEEHRKGRLQARKERNEHNNYKRPKARHAEHTVNNASAADHGNWEIHEDKKEVIIPEGAENKKYETVAIHHKRPVSIPNDRESQNALEHGGYQVPIGREETQSSQPAKKAKLQPTNGGHFVYDSFLVTLGDSQKDNVNEGRERNDERQNACFDGAFNVGQNFSQCEDVKVTSPHDDCGAVTERHNSPTQKMDDDDSPPHYKQPVNIPKRTDYPTLSDHENNDASPFRRRGAMRRRRRQSSESKKQEKGRPENKENILQNTTTRNEEHVHADGQMEGENENENINVGRREVNKEEQNFSDVQRERPYTSP